MSQHTPNPHSRPSPEVQLEGSTPATPTLYDESDQQVELPQKKSNLAFYAYQPDAMPAILELLRVALGDTLATRKTAEFWGWKHQANPFGESYGLYAWDETQKTAAGLRVLMRWGFKSPAGQPILAVRAVDTATHPAYQRQGIFSRLTRQALYDLEQAGVHFIFNTPNQNSLPGYLKMGWQIVETWPVYIKILKPARLLVRAARRGTTNQPWGQFEHYFKPGILTWDAFVNRYQDAIPSLISHWETRRGRVGFRTPRDLAYLQWRYGQHPHVNYGIYALEDVAGLAGFAILRPNTRYGCQEIVLTEIFLNEPSLKLGKLLLKNLGRQLQGDYLVAHFANGTLERELLGRAGFLRVPRKGMTFTVRPLNSLPQNVLDSANWDLSLGDLELF